MKKSIKILNAVVLSFFLAGCFSTKAASKNLALDSSSHYTGPKAKVTVSDFELKTSGIYTPVSLSLKEYFITILNETRRFEIVSPQEADLIISVEVVEFIPESSGGKSGSGGGGSSARSFMGGLLGEVLNKANMQLRLRLIDKLSSNIISSRDIQSQAVENSGKKEAYTPHDKIFKTGLSEYAGTPMGEVIHDCLQDAGRFTVQNIPQNYYKN